MTAPADSRRIFRDMFPVKPPPVGWQLGCDLQDFVSRGLIRKKKDAAPLRGAPAHGRNE